MAFAVDEDDRDDDDENDSVDEDPLESDQDDDEDAVDTIQCPFCKKRVYEHADVCKHCRNYIGGPEASRRVPVFVWVGVVLAGLCVLTWILL